MQKRKKFNDLPQPIRPDLKEKFSALIASGKNVSYPDRQGLDKTIAGFKIKNTNQLWRWDTMEDVL